MNRLLFRLIAILTIATSATATDVSGTITTTTWIAANSPYHVTDSISVPAGDTLTIGPGVDVLFDVDVPFTIDGMIRALGSEAGRIGFRPGAASTWGGLQMGGPTEHVLEYVDVRGVSHQLQKLLASDGEGKNNAFGMSVAIDGDIMVVGANQDDEGGELAGAAYVFRKDHNQSGAWEEIRKLTADSAQEHDFFGGCVDVDGDVIVVGSTGDDRAGPHAGAVYVFCRNEGGADNWGLVKRITASDPSSSDSFGASIAVDGDIIVVGAHRKYDPIIGRDIGAVYLFERNTGGTDNWGQVRKIVASDASSFCLFGSSVAIHGDVLSVGSPGYYGRPSKIYVLYRHHGGADNWGEVKKIATAGYDGFGASVAMDGYVLVVGAPYEKEDDLDIGAVHVFYRDKGGTDNWGRVARVTSNHREDDSSFGESVAVSGGFALVGMYCYDQTGRAHLFSRDHGGTDTWGEVAKILPSDPGSLWWGFGWVVDVDGNTATVGTTKGAFVYSVADLVQKVTRDGVSVSGSVASISHSTICRNDVGFSVSGGGKIIVTNSTVTDNRAAFRTAFLGGTVSFANSILWNPSFGEGVVSASYSNIQGGYEGTGNISSDPLFIDPVDDDYSLLWGSPGIDTGDPSVLDPDGTRSDMGAFSFPHGVSVAAEKPTTTALLPNTPNPFNPSTTIPYTLMSDDAVSLCIYNVLGQHVRTLVSGHRSAGHHTVTWNGRDDRGMSVASGVYLYRLTVGKTVRVRRMTLIR
jgi:hypothetical protein